MCSPDGRISTTILDQSSIQTRKKNVRKIYIYTQIYVNKSEI